MKFLRPILLGLTSIALAGLVLAPRLESAPISSYPAATTPLTGAETVIGTQTGNTVQITTQAIATLGSAGSVSVTGTPSTGQPVKWSGAASITNGNFSGDCTTTNTLALTCLNTNGSPFGTFATQNYATPPAIGGTTPAAGSFTTGSFTGALTTNVNGTTQCVQANSAGVLSGTGGICGPGGTNNQVQYNNSGTINGFDLAGDCTLSVPNITCTKTSGVPFGTFATQNFTTPPAIGAVTPAAGSFTNLSGSGTITFGAITGSSQCLQINTSGVVSGTGSGCASGGGGGGTVTTTGSPASGNLAKFSGATSIVNGDLSGDCTTSGTLAITCTKTSGSAFGTFATQSYASPPAIGGTTPAAGAFTTLGASSTVTLSGITGSSQCLQVNTSGVVAGVGSPCSSGGTPGSPSGSIQYNNSGAFAAAPLTYKSASNVQIGPADAASPTAMTLNAQNTATGTSNVAGANLTVNGSAGTGTGNGGSIIFQTAPAGTTGTSQNAQQALLTLDANAHAGFASGHRPAPSGCGGSPVVNTGSTDAAGEVTTGTSGTSCTVTFNIAYTSAPFCTVVDASNTADLTTYSISTVHIAMALANNSGDHIYWTCFGL